MRHALKEIGLPVFAIAAALLLFGVFVWFAGVSPLEVWVILFKGAFGDWFSWQNTLQRAAPLPYALPLPANLVGTLALCVAGAMAGAAWIALAGWLRQYRGINETISSLLLAYIAIGLFKHLVEGVLRDPASLNKPSTFSLNEGMRIGGIGGSDVHWGLAVGVIACLAA